MTTELIEKLRQRTKPLRERLRNPVGDDLREPYDVMLNEAADTIERLENEVTAYDVRMDNDKAEIARQKALHHDCAGQLRLALNERDAYQQAADKMAAEHKVERDSLAQQLRKEQLEVQVLAADAARYRWLTEDHPALETRKLVQDIAGSLWCRGKGSSDAAIDNAMKDDNAIKGEAK